MVTAQHAPPHPARSTSPHRALATERVRRTFGRSLAWLLGFLRLLARPARWPAAFRAWAPSVPPPEPALPAPTGWRERVPLLLVAVGVIAYAAIFSWVTIWRYETFQTLAWDLGTYNQSIYTTAFGQGLFYYTTEIPSGVGGSILGTHVPLILFAVVPFVYVLPGPPTILAIQASVIALGAFPTYALARKLLGSARWGVLLAFGYLLCPLTQGTGWYDFHPEVFFPVTVLSALFFLAERRTWPFLACWLLALASLEVIAPFLAIFALVSLLASHWHPRLAPLVVPAYERRLLLAGALLASAWFVVAYLVTAHFSVLGGNVISSNYEERWTVLGASSVYTVLPYALLHPSNAGAALRYDGPMKTVYVLLLFGSLAFLPFLGSFRYLAPVLAWTGIALLSNVPSNYTIEIQYTAMVLPFLVAGAISGLVVLRASLERLSHARSLTSRPRLRRGVRRASVWSGPALLLVALATTSLVASPLLVNAVDSWAPIPTGIPAWTTHDAWMHEVLGLVPPRASVLTTGPIFPEVSDRPNAYVLPSPGTRFATNLTYGSLLNQYANASDYILLDYDSDVLEAALLQNYVPLTGWGVLAAADGIYLYERGYAGPPQLFVPEQRTIAGGELTLGNAVVDTANASSAGPALLHPPGTSGGNLMWSGPGLLDLGPGAYSVSFALRLRSSGPSTQAEVQVREQPLTVYVVSLPLPEGHHYQIAESTDRQDEVSLGSADLRPGALGPWNVTGNVTLNVPWDGSGILNTLGWALDDRMALELYSISVTQIAAAPPA